MSHFYFCEQNTDENKKQANWGNTFPTTEKLLDMKHMRLLYFSAQIWKIRKLAKVKSLRCFVWNFKYIIPKILIFAISINDYSHFPEEGFSSLSTEGRTQATS